MIRLSPSDFPRNAGEESTWSNPAKLSGKVRELAHRAHPALKADPRPHVLASRNSEASRQELRDLRIQLARLQQKIRALRLGGLVPWIDALKRLVETRLNITEKEEKR
jgi:hypothetical protein